MDLRAPAGVRVRTHLRSPRHHSICTKRDSVPLHAISTVVSPCPARPVCVQRSSGGIRGGTGSASTGTTRRASSRTATGCWMSFPSCGQAPRPSSRRVPRPAHQLEDIKRFFNRAAKPQHCCTVTAQRVAPGAAAKPACAPTACVTDWPNAEPAPSASCRSHIFLRACVLACSCRG